MSERYYITGAQLGVIKACAENSKEPEVVKVILKEIEDEQFIGNIHQDERDKKRIEIIKVKE